MIAGAVLTAFDPILIPVAALVIVGGLWSGDLAISEERAEAIRLDAMRRSMTDTWYRWLVAAVALGVLGFATLVVWESSGFVSDDCTEASPCWQGTVAWATWIISWLAAVVTGGIGIVLGALRLFARHHTRPA